MSFTGVLLVFLENWRTEPPKSRGTHPLGTGAKGAHRRQPHLAARFSAESSPSAFAASFIGIKMNET